MPDFSVLLPHLLNIAVLYIILRYLLYKPVKNFMDARTARITGEIEHAETMRRQAEEEASKAQEILTTAKSESRETINQAAGRAQAEAAEIIAKAKVEAEEIIIKAQSDAEKEREQYKKELLSQTGDIAVKIAEQILKREVRQEDNSAIIDSFLTGEEA